MKNLTLFQFIFIGVFAAFVLIGVIAFATYRGRDDLGPNINLLAWGTLDEGVVQRAIRSANLPENMQLTYVKKDKSNFDNELLSALASRDVRNPDLILTDHNTIFKNRDLLMSIPFETYSSRNFRDNFIEGTEIFLRPQGVLALPMAIDPLVMYWNRSLFNDSGIVNPPEFWDEFINIAPILTERVGAIDITQSAVAMGEYTNVDNAKAILSTLIMQAGDPIVSLTEGRETVVLGNRHGFNPAPAITALNFYTDFADPHKNTYSWNASLPSSQDFFIADDLSIYFGFASEIRAIKERNPFLNFDVAIMPQVRDMTRRVVYGEVQGIAVINSSRNIKEAIQAALLLSGREAVEVFAHNSGLPPARRDLITAIQTDPESEVFYRSAVWVKTWPEPIPQGMLNVNVVFREMVEDITASRRSLPDAVKRAQSNLRLLFRQ